MYINRRQLRSLILEAIKSVGKIDFENPENNKKEKESYKDPNVKIDPNTVINWRKVDMESGTSPKSIDDITILRDNLDSRTIAQKKGFQYGTAKNDSKIIVVTIANGKILKEPNVYKPEQSRYKSVKRIFDIVAKKKK